MATILSPGIYRILEADSIDHRYLTYAGDHVTILPPGVVPDTEQEWHVILVGDGNIIIQRPSNFPVSFLSYRNAPKEPKEGDEVELRVSEFLLNEWHYSPGPEKFSLRVAGTKFGITIAPSNTYPPILELGKERLLEWRFERLRLLEKSDE